MQDTKDAAEALRLGLLGGFVEPAEIIAWADNVILAGETPSAELIELSLSGSKCAAHVERALAALPGIVQKEKVALRLIRQLAAHVEAEPSQARYAARFLYDMYLEGYIPSPAAEDEMIRLDDSFLLAEAGTWGTLDTATQELTMFLAEWSVH